MKPLLLPAVAIGLACLGIPRLSAGTAADRPDLEFLVSHAELIAEVQIEDSRAILLPDGTIETRYTISTILPMKGVLLPVQEIRIPGGVVASRGLVLPGMPSLSDGDRTILFLSAPGAVKNWRMPVGMAAGSFQVVRGTDGGRRVVRDLRRLGEAGLEVGDYDQLVDEIFAEVIRQR